MTSNVTGAAATRSSVRPPIPKEHGAYGAVAFPIATALLAGRCTVSAVALAAASVSFFVGHESLLVLLGRRGKRIREQQRSAAVAWGAAFSVFGVLGVVVSMVTAPRGLVAWMVPWAGLGVAAVVYVFANKERTLPGEVVAVTALAGASFPVARAAGLATSVSLELGGVWVLGFALTTAAVQGLITSSRGRGPRTIALMAAALSAVALVLLFACAIVKYLPLWIVGACLPPIAASIWMYLSPPAPSDLRRVGWILVAGNLATMVTTVWFVSFNA